MFDFGSIHTVPVQMAVLGREQHDLMFQYGLCLKHDIS